MTPTPPVSGTLAVTATLSAPTATATPLPTVAVTPLSTQEIGRQFEQQIQPMLDQVGMNRAQYREVVRQQVFRDKLTKALADEVPTAEKQVELDYLLFKDKATADQAAAALAKGTSWEDVLAQYGPKPTPAAGEEGTTPEDAAAAGAPEATPAAPAAGTGTPVEPPTATPEPNAFELGPPTWFTRHKLTTDWALSKPEEADAVLALAKGQPSPVLSGGRGFYLARVRDLAESRAVDEAELKTRREGALDEWLKGRKEALEKESKIQRYPLEAFVPAEPPWFIELFNRLMATPVATVPGGGLSISTVAPPAEATGPAATPARGRRRSAERKRLGRRRPGRFRAARQARTLCTGQPRHYAWRHDGRRAVTYSAGAADRGSGKCACRPS